MRSRSSWWVVCPFALVVAGSGCASCPPCEQAQAPCAASGTPAAPPAAASEAPLAAAPTAAPAETSAAPTPAPTSAPPAPAPPPAEPLPEVVVENVGLHIGGGPNDDATKAPFLKAIEAHFDELRACYVKVQDPEKGGTFGVDLRIGRDGGRASVKQPRTGMKGTEFRECVLKVFESVEFEKPKRGPTMISYSVRYTLKK
jgi:hypothetical protein